jgi:hypothetical protein
MKTLLTALLCILAIGIGMTASATPDTSPDVVVCVDYLTPDVVVADLNCVAETPHYDPATVSYATIAPDVSVCTAYLPDCSDPEPLDSSPDEPYSNYTSDISTLNALLDIGDPVPLEHYPTASDTGDPCVTNTETSNWNGDPTEGKSAECSPDNGANDHLNIALNTTVNTALKPCGS